MTAEGAAEVVAIDVDRTRAVTISWADGAQAVFPIEELRAACPCAACRSRRDRGEDAWPLPGATAPLAIAEAELVGAWGIAFTWSDGHGTGIYPWDSLRRWHDAGAGTGSEPTGEADPD